MNKELDLIRQRFTYNVAEKLRCIENHFGIVTEPKSNKLFCIWRFPFQQDTSASDQWGLMSDLEKAMGSFWQGGGMP